jgi:flavin reductase (DIM6/NTAB) family NADH-FMN oxidoreductase RutF
MGVAGETGLGNSVWVMQYDFATIPAKDRYKLMVSTIVPRPVAWVVTKSAAGVINAAPYSFFNGVGGDPPLISISVEGKSGGGRKDTAANIRETGEFVVNLVDFAVAPEMVVTAIDFGAEVSEVAEAGLAVVASVKVSAPRIVRSPVAFECKLYKLVELPHERDLVLGRIVYMHIADEAVLDAARCYVDTPRLDLVGRMHGGGWYSRTREQFEVPRMTVEGWKGKAG